MTAVAMPSELVTSVGTPALVRVRLSRGRTPMGRTSLVLTGTTALGFSRDVTAVTDDSGIAVFRLPPVARAGTYQFEIRTSTGTGFPGQPGVLLSVRAARPSRLRLNPEVIDFGRTGDSVTAVATVPDAIRNAITKAGKTMRNMHWFEVIDTRGHIEKAKIAHWQVTIKVGFTLED